MVTDRTQLSGFSRSHGRPRGRYGIDDELVRFTDRTQLDRIIKVTEQVADQIDSLSWSPTERNWTELSSHRAGHEARSGIEARSLTERKSTQFDDFSEFGV